MIAPRGGLRSTWPIHPRQSVQLLCGWAALTVVWIGLGALLTGPLAGGSIMRVDERVAQWMVAHRTPTWSHLTVWGSLLAETTTKVVVTAVLALAFLKLWQRWFEPALLVVSLVLEAAAFLAVTTVVGRDRPDVPRLDDSPVGSSFPSGHTAAAAAYAAIAVVVFLHTRKRWARVVVVAISALVPVVVALSRMYRGMHFLSDTVAGTVLGGAAVAITALVLTRSPEGAAAVNPSAEAAEFADPSGDAVASVEHDRIEA